jgi:hypothetical protein
MQLDSTRITVRERTLPEVFDLALHVTREFFGPWLACSLLAIVPLAVLNYFLVGWMTSIEPEYDSDWAGGRYLWNMTLLVFLEAPLASVFVVAYLGPAVFRETKTVGQVLRDVLRYAPQLFLCQLLLRGILPAWLLYLTVDRYESGPVEFFFVPMICLWSAAMRAFRPYINEIVLLERNPLMSRNPQQITIARRSSHLHNPSSADLFVRWILSAAIGLVLTLLALLTTMIALGILIGHWWIAFDPSDSEPVMFQITWYDLQIAYPMCLWLVVAWFSVVRFLSYLDLRIRHEGWEVELLMRAEALRMAARLG